MSRLTVDFSAHVRDFDWFLDRLDLDGARIIGERDVLCRCPAHDDYTPSLHVLEDERGLMVHCYAGCSRSDIEDALEDESPRESRPKLQASPRERGVIVARYPYTDYLGCVIYVKRRYEPKSFDFARPVIVAARTEGPVTWEERVTWDRGLKDEYGNYVVPPVPYHLYGLQKIANRNIWIVDGEKDANALTTLGLHGEKLLATCSPFGMANWPEPHDRDEQDFFHDSFVLRNVTIVADRDEPGYKAAAGLAEMMRDNCCRVSVVEAREGKDAFDHLRAGFGLDDFRVIDDE